MKFNSDRARHLPSSSLIHPSEVKLEIVYHPLNSLPFPLLSSKSSSTRVKKKKNKTKKGQEISTKIFRNLERENHPLNSPLQTPCIRSPYVEPSNRAARLNKKKKKKKPRFTGCAFSPLLSSPLSPFIPRYNLSSRSLPSSSLLFFSRPLSLHRNNLFHSPRTEKSSQCKVCRRASNAVVPYCSSLSSPLEEGRDSTWRRRCNNRKICNSPAYAATKRIFTLKSDGSSENS